MWNNNNNNNNKNCKIVLRDPVQLPRAEGQGLSS
jgi:hypothetical protein